MKKNVSKRMKMLGFFGSVVAISLATNLTSNYVMSKNSGADDESQQQLPAAYAKFAGLASAGETDFTVAAELSVHAVVHVKTKTPAQQMNFGGDPLFEYFFGRSQQERETPMQEAAGSGVIISPDGYIVTNNHVVDKSAQIEVVLNDKRTFNAKIIGSDPNTDIALLKIDAKDLPIIKFGNSDDLKIGEWVLAVGNPFNLTSTVTAGIVSAKARNINISNSSMKIESFIQTDAAINPGNSGGALVNTHGELIGINTAITSQTGSYIGYGFAIPVSIVQKVVADIKQFGVVQRAILGVEISDINDKLAKEKDLKTMLGAYVGKVVEQGAAKAAGVKEGDIIQKVNDITVKSVAELQEQISRYRPGDKITIEVLRNNSNQKLKVELKNRQGSTSVVSSEASNDLLGAKFKEIDDKTKRALKLNYGVEIESLSKGKLAEQGAKPGFIILKINNKAIQSVDDIQVALDTAQTSEERVLYIKGLYPNGRSGYFAINLDEQ